MQLAIVSVLINIGENVPLAKRIIPVILHKNGQLVKGQKFVNDRVIGHALQSARIHAMRGVDELTVLDVTATQENREPNYKLIESLSATAFTPITVGGGIKTAEHVKNLLRAGADKVCVKSAYLHDIRIIKELSDKFGKSTITVSLDISKFADIVSVAQFGVMLEKQGAGEILLQSMDVDGTMSGYKYAYIKELSELVSVPVIASGGCSGYEDMYQALRAGADAVAAGALFAFTEATPAGAAEYLDSKGIEVRLTRSSLNPPDMLGTR